MKSHPNAGLRLQSAQTSAGSYNVSRFNALKHGLRSGSVVLPGDDVTAFMKLRERLFHLYQPRTVEEAQCVETIAASHWRIARCRLEQGLFKQHLGAVLSGDPDATGYLCNPDPHTLHHRSMDCVLEEARLERFKSKAQETLRLLQKQRTQNFSIGNSVALEDYRVFLAEGEPLPQQAPDEHAAAEPATAKGTAHDGAADPATRSEHGRNGRIHKRNPATPGPRLPKHWSRRQREAAAQRMGAG